MVDINLPEEKDRSDFVAEREARIKQLGSGIVFAYTEGRIDLLFALANDALGEFLSLLDQFDTMEKAYYSGDEE